jgi:hypothetical protein
MKRVVWEREREKYESENGCLYLSAVSYGWNAEAMCYITTSLLSAISIPSIPKLSYTDEKFPFKERESLKLQPCNYLSYTFVS